MSIHRILLLGSGGREHALSWRLSRSPLLDQLFVCPGNGGTEDLPKTQNLSLPIGDFPALVRFAVDNQITLVVPGPEQPLVDGVETHFRKVGIPVFGPSQNAARMEGSKAFAKAFMARHKIPTADFRTFSSTQFEEACKYVKKRPHKVVLKASGLAAGKGVLIPASVEEAISGLKEIMVSNVFGAAGNEVVIEELLEGPEISVLAFSDGYSIVHLPAAQDHKRIGEGDTGPNTGGMGAYAPAPVATHGVMERIMKETLRPTIDGMRKEGFPFVGMLFTGFILTASGPKVLEYNVRFGDPETEALMLLLHEETDLAAVLQACAEHRLDSVDLRCRPGFSVSVILASAGYPGTYPKGRHISISNVPPNVEVFHAGTTKKDGGLLTSGGRVLAVTAHANTLDEALTSAYNGVESVNFEGKTFRKDIAYRALKTNLGSVPSWTYAKAGVSVEAGNALVDAIKPSVKLTRRPGSDPELGGFGGLFDLAATGFKDPVLVSGTDGVGTKLRIAVDTGIHEFVGIDLVAMSVNDLLVQGAEPLYFLDYFACSHLDVDIAASVIGGVADGCREANCALIGGETAEMPDMYKDGDYDLAGFAVGAVEREMILPRPDIEAGDVVLGLSSSGLHSNGFSLVRKILAQLGITYTFDCPWNPGVSVGRTLLEPTRIYARQVLPVVRRGLVKGMSHITGGGFTENIPRMLPKGAGCLVDAGSWELPSVFRFLINKGPIEPLEMAKTFNNGIGLVIVVSKTDVDEVKGLLSESGKADVYRIGEVTKEPGVTMKNLESWSSQH